MKGFLRYLAVPGLLALTISCGDTASREGRTTQARSEFARVKAARAELVAARQALDRARHASDTTSSGQDALRRAQEAYDAAFMRDQKTLSAFLNVALNDRPDSPETREALALYARSAVEGARYLLREAEDGRPAVQVLEPVERSYRVLGLDVPGDLATTLAEARRFQGKPPTPPPTAHPRPARRSRR